MRRPGAGVRGGEVVGGKEAAGGLQGGVGQRLYSKVHHACCKKCRRPGRMLNPGSAALGTKILRSDTRLTVGRLGDTFPNLLSC
jgi:hypothetical protein